jgi:Na+-transporting methylmalonyl-CoA/oxaloacetate decarboxylase gamma subunit
MFASVIAAADQGQIVDALVIAAGGMAIVFVALSLISLSIKLLPGILQALEPYFPAAAETGPEAVEETGELDLGIVVAIAAALHSELRQQTLREER